MPKQGDLKAGRDPSATQPDPSSTLKAQTRFQIKDSYDPESVKTEFDFVHERINQVVESMPNVAALSTTASSADTVAKINEILAALGKSGLTAK